MIGAFIAGGLALLAFAVFLLATLWNDDIPPRDGDGW